MSLHQKRQAATVASGFATPPPEPVMNERNLDEIVQRPDEEFSFKLESINSAFGISADTLKAIADSYGVPPERIIIRALTQWAKVEIPDLDLDEPLLSEAQLEALRLRRLRIDEERQQAATGPTLLDLFKEAIREQGDTDEHSENSGTRHGGPH